MPWTWLGLAFAALIAQPTAAQDYRKNFVECTKELGLQADPSYLQKLQSEGRFLIMLPLPPPHCRKGSPMDVTLINGQTIILWLLIRCDNAKLFVALRNDSDTFAFA
jgi:hypothetical protein